MLPIVLVLFVASSAFGAPSVSISQVGINEVAPAYDSGRGMTRGLADRVLELVDGGDTNIYILTLEQILQDLANQPNSQSQALAVSQILAILGEIGYGRPGSSCAAANAINQYASNAQGGKSYLSVLAQAVDTVAALAANPASLRQSSPSSGGNCANYQFEAAWSGILNSASPYNIAPLTLVAANVFTASLPSVVAVVEQNLGPLVNFLRAAANGNAYGYVAAAKQALRY
ncbi:fibroin light chain (L-fibroin) domain-containing protein [Phthorimaea operculella]|nr:fibroin light chain (L-fibroin) domain-containing protein [Phthorimaea operculella]